jgi:AcrR family transcriptional regulator
MSETVTTHRQQRDEQRRTTTRNKLLDAAAVVFSKQGYHHTLISDIVAQAKVGQGTFYRNFQSKREVFEALFDSFFETLFLSFTTMSTRLPTTAQEYHDASFDALNHIARICVQHRELVLLLLRDGPTVDRAFAEKFERMYDQFATLASFYLEHAIEQGFARPCNPAVVAQALVGVGMRLVSLWLRDKVSSANIEDLIRESVDFAFRGFGPSGPQPHSPAGAGATAAPPQRKRRGHDKVTG